MKRETFYEKVKKEITKYLPKRYAKTEFTVSEVSKMSDSYQGLMKISSESFSCSPVINLDFFYDSFIKDGRTTFESCMQEIAQLFLKVEFRAEQVREDAFERLSFKHVFPRLVRRSDDTLKRVPHRILWGNIGITYVFEIAQKNEILIAQVTSEIAEQHNLTEEMLYQHAVENIKSLFRPVFLAADEFLDEKEQDERFYLLQHDGPYGASIVLLQDEVLPKIAETLQDDFYIIPCSEHGILILAKHRVQQEMVVEQQRTLYEESRESLAPCIFLYEQKTGTVIAIP